MHTYFVVFGALLYIALAMALTTFLTDGLDDDWED